MVTSLLEVKFPLLRTLVFEFFSKIAFAIPYDRPPKMNPIKVADSVLVTLNASTIIENVSVAINTPLPKAIIVVINFCERLPYRDAKHPISKGLEAINPKSKESTKPFDVRISDHIIIVQVDKRLLNIGEFCINQNYWIRNKIQIINRNNYCHQLQEQLDLRFIQSKADIENS